MFNKNKFFTTITTVDNYGGKAFFSATGKTEQESIDKALLNKQIGIGNDDEILAIRTYDNLSHVKMKHAQMQHTGGPPSLPSGSPWIDTIQYTVSGARSVSQGGLPEHLYGRQFSVASLLRRTSIGVPEDCSVYKGFILTRFAGL